MINHKTINDLRHKIQDKNDALAAKRINWIKRNRYFYDLFIKSLKYIVKKNARVLHVRCSVGYILNALDPDYGVGTDSSNKQIIEAQAAYPELKFLHCNEEDISIEEKFDYIIISHVEDIVDVKAVLDSIKKCSTRETRIIIVSYNYLWQPLIRLTEILHLRYPQALHNWWNIDDLNSIVKLSNYEVIKNEKLVLCPYYIPLLSWVINKFIARIPLIRNLPLINLTTARPLFDDNKDYSVSVIIPCKNEEGNIEDAVKRIPQLGSGTEIIFCDDCSTDGTVAKVEEMIEKFPDKKIKLVEGPGICKSENVWVGFDAAESDILMILDADLTVLPEELIYFYEAIVNNHGEFINGSRLIYPMTDNAMRLFNIMGNKFFSILFSYILDIKIKDTLCGTKVMWRKDYLDKIKPHRGSWMIKDKWGDYELIFGASKSQLKIIDLPVHYVDRTYGETKMTNRIKNGWTMLKMSLIALFKIKFN